MYSRFHEPLSHTPLLRLEVSSNPDKEVLSCCYVFVEVHVYLLLLSLFIVIIIVAIIIIIPKKCFSKFDYLSDMVSTLCLRPL